MKLLWIFMIAVFAGNVKTEILNKSRQYKNTYASVLREALKAQLWGEQEGPCLDTMMKIMGHADNFTLWAVWILDSFTQPVGQLLGHTYHLGNYDECLNPSHGFLLNPEVPTTQYCMVEVTLTATDGYVKPPEYTRVDHDVTTDVYLKKQTKHGRLLSKMSWGVCVPEICEPSSTAKIARSVLLTSHLGALADSASINTSHCDSADALTSEVPMVFVYFILFLSATTAFCTYCVNRIKTSTRTFANELARSFCLSRNMATLTEVRPGEVHSMNFCRVVACFAVVLVHVYLFANFLFTTDGTEIERILDEHGYSFLRSDIVVDTFLALSGLLFTRGILGDKWQNPLKYIWKRYIRLAAALSAILFYMATTSGHVGDGPIWQLLIDEQRVCVDSWWSNLLMLGNVIHMDKLCNLSTWYVPCDYQLCVLATMLFLIYRKNNKLGKIAYCIFLALSMIIPSVITYINDYPVTTFYGIESLAQLLNRRDFIWWDIYVPSYCRAGPFVVGIAMGYTMYTYKPEHHRKLLGRVPSCLVLISNGILLFGIFAYGLHYYLVHEPVGAAIYAGVNRTVWGVAVCVVIGVAEYGDLPLLNRVFAWYPFAPLSKLTYGVYLTHMPVLQYLYFSIRTTNTKNEFSVIMTLTGLIMFSLAASLALWLLVEAPLININNMLLDKTWKMKTVKSNRLNCNGEINVSAISNGVICNGEKKVL